MSTYGQIKAAALSLTTAEVIYTNSNTVSTVNTLAAGTQGQSVGPIFLANTGNITMNNGSRWVIL